MSSPARSRRRALKILVVGGGGREHAIVRALARSVHAPELFCAPGNTGITADAKCLPDVAADDVEAIVAASTERGVDLVVVGPEAALVAGVVDALEDAGIPAFGPSRAAAELEGSKAFAKELMREAGVPTAAHTSAAQPRGGRRGDRPRLIPGGAEGRRAGGGQGRDHLRRRVRGAGRHRRLLHRAALRPDHGGAGGVPRGRGALAAGPLRRRERRAAGAGPGLQADLRRRRGTEHRRHGQLLAGARLRRGRGRGDRRRRAPADRRRDGAARRAPSTASSTPA